ncbi:MAG: hypothetical protein IJ195_03910 [Lachnospiraceae bacterium]|nr:hypothetical protein [Lachnospiraceae bacterium]
MIKALDDLRAAKDKEVLACMEEFKASKVKTTEFQKKFETDYSYSTLTQELTYRGYSLKWVKDTKEIKVKMSAENARLNLNMTKECKERYEKFLEGKSYNFVHTTAALMNYLDEVEKKEIKVSVEVV